MMSMNYIRLRRSLIVKRGVLFCDEDTYEYTAITALQQTISEKLHPAPEDAWIVVTDDRIDDDELPDFVRRHHDEIVERAFELSREVGVPACGDAVERFLEMVCEDEVWACPIDVGSPARILKLRKRA